MWCRSRYRTFFFLDLSGDIIGKEYHGSGLGLFSLKPIPDLNTLGLELSTKQLALQSKLAFKFDDEWRKLNEFATEVLAKAPIQVGKKRLLSVDRNAKEMKVLFQMLQKQLLKEGFISATTDNVILGLGAEVIYFNRKATNPSQEASCREIMSALRIKSRAHRMIHMIDKIIGVKDFEMHVRKGTVWSVSD